MKIQRLILVLVIFHGGFFVSCQIEKCTIWNNILKCYRSFEHHKHCYETKPYSKTICCSQELKSKPTKSGKELDQYCIGYSETEYELLLNKIYGLTFGILGLVILGLIVYYWRQIANFFCCQNGLVLLVVHQTPNSQVDYHSDVERGGGEVEGEEEIEKIHSSLFLDVPGNNGVPGESRSRRSSIVSTHSSLTKSISRNSFSRNNSLKRENSMTRQPSYNLIRTHSSRSKR